MKLLWRYSNRGHEHSVLHWQNIKDLEKSSSPFHSMNIAEAEWVAWGITLTRIFYDLQESTCLNSVDGWCLPCALIWRFLYVKNAEVAELQKYKDEKRRALEQKSDQLRQLDELKRKLLVERWERLGMLQKCITKHDGNCFKSLLVSLWRRWTVINSTRDVQGSDHYAERHTLDRQNSNTDICRHSNLFQLLIEPTPELILISHVYEIHK